MTSPNASPRTGNAQSPFRFAIAATFTAEPLRPVIQFWSRQLGTDFDVQFAPYNQVIQSLLDPLSVLSSNVHGVNIVLLRPDDLGGNFEQIWENIRHISQELREAPSRMTAPLIVSLCPASDAVTAHEFGRLETLSESALEDTPGIQFIPHQSIHQCYRVDEIHSPEGERLGRIPYTAGYYCALATMLVRHTHALFRAPFKVIALDCDNTLWRGICGEDGPENVSLDPPRRALHEFALDRREEGSVLVLASKNNEEDVLETFRVHPEMPLQTRHFVTWRLNWEPKAASLASISEQLGLSLDSFIFIDDSAKECAEVQDALPEVLTLALPENVSETPRFLEHVWAFDRPVVTEEDRNRSTYYAQAAEFGNEIRRARSAEEFMASLRLRVRIAGMTPDRLPRIAQLTQRTNQFNTTTVRRTEAEIQALKNQGAEILTADVSDRFGDYGLVGVIILRESAEALTVDSMLLSCRALGRGVEHQMLAHVGGLALARNKSLLVLPFRRTAKNQPAMQFADDLLPGSSEQSAQEFTVRMSTNEAAALRWQPRWQTGSSTPQKRQRPNVPQHGIDYAYIARQLSTVPQILQAMKSDTVRSFEPGMTDTERELARIWADLLEHPAAVKPSDNFFDLGGHSLAAVLMLLRVRETFGVDLSIDDVYSGSLTLADVAARIDALQLGSIDPDEYAALLAEIESLTDEEARELLARESGMA